MVIMCILLQLCILIMYINVVEEVEMSWQLGLGNFTGTVVAILACCKIIIV